MSKWPFNPKDYKSGEYMFGIFNRPSISQILATIQEHLGIVVGETVKTIDGSWRKKANTIINPYNPSNITSVTFEDDRMVCKGWTGSPDYKRRAILKYSDITQCVIHIEDGVITFNSRSNNGPLYYWKLRF